MNEERKGLLLDEVAQKIERNLLHESESVGIPEHSFSKVRADIENALFGAENASDGASLVYDIVSAVSQEHDLSPADLHELLVELDVPSIKQAVSIHRDWPKALDSYANGNKLAYDISYGLSKEDLGVLAELHKDGKFRAKIEEVLASCNFHPELADFDNGNYDKYLPRASEEVKESDSYER